MTTEKIGNYSPDFRLECHAKKIMKLDKESRETHYAGIIEMQGKKRGQISVDNLRAEMNRLRLLRRAKEAEHSL